MMQRRDFLATLAGGLLASEAAAQSKTNFVFILADDLGARDLGCYGNRYYATPNLDRLATQGARFTNTYAACPVCSPTRAALLTGRYPTRAGVPRVLFPTDTVGLPDSETTIAQMLKPRGYQTMCVRDARKVARAERITIRVRLTP